MEGEVFRFLNPEFDDARLPRGKRVKGQLKCADYFNSGTPPLYADANAFGDSLVGSQVASGGALNSRIAQGYEFYQRASETIDLEQLEVKFQIYCADESTLTSAITWRLSIVFDRQPSLDGTLPAVADVFESVGVDSYYPVGGRPVSFSNYLAFQNPATMNRFLVLYDELMGNPAGEATSVTDGRENVYMYNQKSIQHIRIPLHGLQSKYIAAHYTTPGFSSTLTSGALYFMWECSEPSALNHTYNIAWIARVWFRDSL